MRNIFISFIYWCLSSMRRNEKRHIVGIGLLLKSSIQHTYFSLLSFTLSLPCAFIIYFLLFLCVCQCQQLTQFSYRIMILLLFCCCFQKTHLCLWNKHTPTHAYTLSFHFFSVRIKRLWWICTRFSSSYFFFFLYWSDYWSANNFKSIFKDKKTTTSEKSLLNLRFILGYFLHRDKNILSYFTGVWWISWILKHTKQSWSKLTSFLCCVIYLYTS